MSKTQDQIDAEAYHCAKLAVERAAEVYRCPDNWTEEDWQRVLNRMTEISQELYNRAREHMR